ncbi:vacuolar protein sorting-associated protein 41 [Trametopsis cervina]|nr:vacuolar protein sorting-associated protein 41 [Trametopsis cervina]
MSMSVHDGDDDSGRFVSHSPDQMSLVGSELQGDQDHGDTNNARSHDEASQIHEELVQNGGGNGRVIAHGSDAGSGDEDAEEAEGENEDSEDESGDEDEDEDEEDEDDEDEEPTLKYERLNGPVDLLQKDSASALTYANNRLVLGTHAGILHVLDLQGERIKSVKPHTASITDICVDETADFIATASLDGQITIYSLNTPEVYRFDQKRPMRTVALEPNFAKRSGRAFVCGGMSGNLTMHEKGWLGHKETILDSGEGPIWQVRWRGRLIAWANDLGVKIYDTTSQMRLIFIDRPADSPRADLFKCTLYWQDDSTLLIAWADHIKVARIRARPRSNTAPSATLPPLVVEITAVFQLDCMIAGIVPHTVHAAPPPVDPLAVTPLMPLPSKPTLTAFLTLAYIPPDTSFLTETALSRAEQARKAAERPELRIISRSGEELASDALSISNFERWSCNDYVLVDIPASDARQTGSYVVMSPKDVVLVRPRDWRDHVRWLVERKRYEEALDEMERQSHADDNKEENAVDAVEIGQKYIEHLVGEGEFVKAARLCPKVCAHDVKRWEDWIFVFVQKHQLQAIIPYVPTQNPTLGHLVYEMILAYFLSHDREALLKTIKDWPTGIYDIPAVIVVVQAELDRVPSSSPSDSTRPDAVILMECLAELYTANRQPGKALPFYLRLRRPNVFDLIREHNLFTAVRDQVLLLVEFDQELMEKKRKSGVEVDPGQSAAITLLVDNIHSIPIGRVVQQLQTRRYYLHLYLDALFARDTHVVSDFADLQVKLYAEYAPTRLIDFLRASNYYSLEEAYQVCNERNLVLEMVFLLGRMGNNRQALTLIIERLGDVNRAIDFAKEQHDDDLWEDLLRYSESRPAFIRGLLENVGAEIEPIRLIRRIKNGLEIPGLKPALIKILHDFNLQASLLQGCQTILNGDSSDLAQRLHTNQTKGFPLSGKLQCLICSSSLIETSQSLLLLFLCRHVVHARCVSSRELIPAHADINRTSLTAKIATSAMIKARLNQGCPVCQKRGDAARI